MCKWGIMLLVCISFVLPSFAQDKQSAVASISATVTTPGSLADGMDTVLLNGMVSKRANGKILFAPICIHTPDRSNLPPTILEIKTVAGFLLCGEPGYVYSITLPACADLVGPDGASITINSFRSHPSSVGITGTDGTQQFRVSANLEVRYTQPQGRYINTHMVIFIVNYN